ncbi:MAG: peptide-methionine (S)-S-oxide reductase MsrA [Gemmataceae bacterium]
MSANPSVATFGGGCFWCLEAVFEQVRGVHSVVSGYAGGHVENPSYEEVCGKKTGHAEVVQVTFDPAAVSYRDLLGVFFATHDPTTPNRQGADVGPQYRSVIYTHDDEQKQIAMDYVAWLDAEKVFPNPIVTEVSPLTRFYPAEGYHQGFYRNNPMQGYCMAVVSPKVAKFRKQFQRLLKSAS